MATKIGITERGDAGLDFSWVSKMDNINAAVLVTKNVNEKFSEEVLPFKDKVIVHCTCTGLGGTIYEPNVPKWQTQIDNIRDMVEMGFPAKQVVIRIDPIIPTNSRMLDVAEKVVCASSDMFRRYRVSLVDMYPHVRNRFLRKRLILPYGDSFYPSPMHTAKVDCWIRMMRNKYGVHFEACSESRLKEPEHIGCVSEKDCRILGIEYKGDGTAFRQRRECMCIPAKTELLSNRQPCAHDCVYCYWKKKEESYERL